MTFGQQQRRRHGLCHLLAVSQLPQPQCRSQPRSQYIAYKCSLRSEPDSQFHFQCQCEHESNQKRNDYGLPLLVRRGVGRGGHSASTNSWRLLKESGGVGGLVGCGREGSPERALASLFSKLNLSRDLRLMRMQLIDKSVLKNQNKKQKLNDIYKRKKRKLVNRPVCRSEYSKMIWSIERMLWKIETHIQIQIQIVLCMRIEDVCMYLYFSQRSLVEWTRALLNNNFQL